MNNNKYYEHGASWEEAIYTNIAASRTRAWIVAIFSMSLALISMICLALLLPLKTYEPYVITVDQSTGYTQVVRSLNKGNLSENDALTESNLVRYVSMREGYNPYVIKDNYKKIALLSDKKALQEFEELWSAENPLNPSKLLGYKGSIDIKIKSVSFLGDDMTQIRFVSEKRERDIIKASHWSVIIKFRYTQKPMKMIERHYNPLGFQVISYRKSQEMLEK